jgi:Fic family protein
MIHKVDTFKSGPFIFSLDYDREKLQRLLAEAQILYKTVADIPVLPDIAARLEEDLIRKSIFGTAAIEGNPLSEEAVKKMLSQEEMKGKIENAEKQIRNLKDAYEIIRKTTPSGKPIPLEEAFIKNLHKIITKDCENPENIPGGYRNRPVKVGDEEHGGVYAPPKAFDDIKNLMVRYIEWINSPDVQKEDPVIRACLAHYHLALIHPFDNGNGRTARAVEAVLIKSGGVKYVPHMLSNYYYKHIDDYFRAFSLAERNETNDITPFVEFFLKGLVSSLEEIKLIIFAWIREYTLKDYYLFLRRKKDITQRQHDLMSLLLETRSGEFTLKDLFEKEKFRIIYRKVSERTARRDLKNLEANKLVLAIKDGVYVLNAQALG